MPDPDAFGPTLGQLLNQALLPSFGENLPLYYSEVERHQDEARELIDRARRGTQELINEALNRLTFSGGTARRFWEKPSPTLQRSARTQIGSCTRRSLRPVIGTTGK